MSQKNKRITLYKSFIVILSVLAVIVLLAAIYLFITYEQDKNDNNEPTVPEVTVQGTTTIEETTVENDSEQNKTTTAVDTTTGAVNDKETTSSAEDLQGADKAKKLVEDDVIKTYGNDYQDVYYIEDIGLNNDMYVYCLRRTEDTYAQKWYYVNSTTFELTVE